jgi:hypothetical protein
MPSNLIKFSLQVNMQSNLIKFSLQLNIPSNLIKFSSEYHEVRQLPVVAMFVNG